MCIFALAMKTIARFSKNSSVPLFRQLMNNIIAKIENGSYARDKPLPSLNAMTIMSGLSKETVIKAYRHLCKEGVVSSLPGKGYFIRDGYLSRKPSLFVLMDKFSQHQQTIIDGIVGSLDGCVDITIRMHYQDINRFEIELNMALDRYDWYLIFPHFSIDIASQGMVLKLLNTIPQEKLIVVDRLVPGVSSQSGASYQSIEMDIPAMLLPVLDDIRKYKVLRYISLSVSLYGNLVAETIEKFCEEHSVPLEILKEVPTTICKKDLFFVSGSRLDMRLSELIRAMCNSGLTIGTDVGLICYNDFPLNEFILGGLTTLSTDFSQMGRTAAQMILSNKLTKIHCPCALIRRNTF